MSQDIVDKLSELSCVALTAAAELMLLREKVEQYRGAQEVEVQWRMEVQSRLKDATTALETVERMASIGENLPTGANFRRLRWIARDSLDKIR